MILSLCILKTLVLNSGSGSLILLFSSTEKIMLHSFLLPAWRECIRWDPYNWSQKQILHNIHFFLNIIRSFLTYFKACRYWFLSPLLFKIFQHTILNLIVQAAGFLLFFWGGCPFPTELLQRNQTVFPQITGCQGCFFFFSLFYFFFSLIGTFFFLLSWFLWDAESYCCKLTVITINPDQNKDINLITITDQDSVGCQL